MSDATCAICGGAIPPGSRRLTCAVCRECGVEYDRLRRAARQKQQEARRRGAAAAHEAQRAKRDAEAVAAVLGEEAQGE